VTYESVTKPIFREQPTESLVGILLAVISLIVTTLLARQKRKVAAQIQSSALATDAVETLACSYLSLTLLVGLGLNAWVGRPTSRPRDGDLSAA
jgi:divalent metal cation (Fe/Co/Zn/Cd) transporter